MDCVFCRIATGEIPAAILEKDDKVIVLRDINPQAPVHLLILPIEHIASIADVDKAKVDLLGHIILVANKMALKEGIATKGYRLAINCRREGGQTVDHLHVHLLGGRQLNGRLG